MGIHERSELVADASHRCGPVDLLPPGFGPEPRTQDPVLVMVNLREARSLHAGISPRDRVFRIGGESDELVAVNGRDQPAG
jgi:hypothetical protein